MDTSRYRKKNNEKLFLLPFSIIIQSASNEFSSKCYNTFNSCAINLWKMSNCYFFMGSLVHFFFCGWMILKHDFVVVVSIAPICDVCVWPKQLLNKLYLIFGLCVGVFCWMILGLKFNFICECVCVCKKECWSQTNEWSALLNTDHELPLMFLLTILFSSYSQIISSKTSFLNWTSFNSHQTQSIHN